LSVESDAKAEDLQNETKVRLHRPMSKSLSACELQSPSSSIRAAFCAARLSSLVIVDRRSGA
jgi:hypothetical protein